MTVTVRTQVVGSVISGTPFTGRLISLRISASPRNVTVTQVYAPTSDHDDEEVVQFYDQLDSIMAKTPKKEILVD